MPETVRQRLERAWYAGRAPLLLRPFAWLYRLLLALRRAAYRSGLLRSGHPGVPVFVVGNLTVGGTGKTPVTLWLAGQLQAHGLAVGIASRGHGGSARGPLFVTAGSDPRIVGDEALLLARRSGAIVCIGRRRAAAARALADRGCEVVLCDDGLQHLALRRDLEIAVVDGARGLGNGALLPAGPLREPASRLQSVDLVLVQGRQSPAGLPAPGRALHFVLEPEDALSLQTGQRRPLRSFAGAPVHAVAGIGHPARFFDQLRNRGLDVIEHPFPDHHAYEPADLAFGDGHAIVMTEKDAVKCDRFADGRMWCLPVGARFEPPDAARLVDAVMQRVPGGGRSGA